MTTIKKINANRRNAQHSSGPKTKLGKQRASRNGLIHGFYSSAMKFINEDEAAEYQEFREKIFKEYAPQGALEDVLVDKIASGLWKQRSAEELLDRHLREFRGGRFISQLTGYLDEEGLMHTPSLPARRKNHSRFPMLECESIHFTVTKSHAENKCDKSDKEGNKNEKSTEADAEEDRTQIDAHLKSSIDSVLRCQAVMEKGVYRAIDQLESGREQRANAVPANGAGGE
jgi:hypothetical protein